MEAVPDQQREERISGSIHEPRNPRVCWGGERRAKMHSVSFKAQLIATVQNCTLNFEFLQSGHSMADYD